VNLVLGELLEAIFAGLWMSNQLKGHKGAKLLHWKGLGVIDSSLFLNHFCVAYFKEENIMHLTSLDSLHL
jgi:hypothetical protein